MPHNPPPLPDFTRWPSFPFEGDMRVKRLADPVEVEPPRSGEDAADCVACNTPDDAYIWVSERWRVRGMDRPTGLPVVLILECRSHFDIGDLPNLLAAELGVMTVRLERAIRSLDGVARVHVNRWGDGSAHLHMWFLARPYGRLQLRGTFLSLWDDLLPVIPEEQWLENLALVAEWLAGFGGRAVAEPAHIHWESPSTFGNEPASVPDTTPAGTWHPTDPTHPDPDRPTAGTSPLAEVATANAETRDLSAHRDAVGNASAPATPHDRSALSPGTPTGAASATTATPPAPALEQQAASPTRGPAAPALEEQAASPAAGPAAPTAEQQGASPAPTAKAVPGQARDAAGTGAASTTATTPTQPPPDAPAPVEPEPEPEPDAAGPAQHDPKAGATNHEVATAADKTTATQSP